MNALDGAYDPGNLGISRRDCRLPLGVSVAVARQPEHQKWRQKTQLRRSPEERSHGFTVAS